MARAYLDWAAGAPLDPAAAQAAREAMALGAGNPSSMHAEGRRARDLIERARAEVAALCGCEPREVVFTGSGSEANALALAGGAAVSAIEHPSALLAGGGAAARLPCGPDGVVQVGALPELLQASGARVVGLQLANNETGVVQPVAQAAALARQHGARLHCDAVQAAGKLDLAEVTARCATVAVSAHKLGGLAGAGALVVRRGVELLALIPGHQERGLRGGTHALAAIAAFGAAAREAMHHRDSRRAAVARATAELERVLLGAAQELELHGAGASRVAGIVSAGFPGADGETLLVALDLAGVACSHGAACASGALEPSHVLLAMGLTRERARASVRFSVGWSTSDEELALLERTLPGALRAARAAAKG